MITCPECGHESKDSVVHCANCGNYLPWPTRNAADEKAAAELEAMLKQLDLPELADETAGGASIDGARLFDVLMHSRATAGEIASMDVEELAHSVAYRRRKKVAPGAVDPALTDRRIAEAILDYARQAPPDLRAGQLARAASGEDMPEEMGMARSGQGPIAIQIARIAIVIVVLVSMFAPWGRDGGVISNGWVFAIWFTLLSCGVLGALYVGLFLYALTIVPAVSRDWVSWVPRDVRAFLPEGALEAIDPRWIFWLSRLALLLWLILGPYFILGTNIRDWPLNITWGAKLFLVAIALANAVEGINLLRWGRETSGRLWMAVGAIWICLSVVLLPVVTLITGIEYTPRRQLSAAEVLAQYQAGERSFRSAILRSAHLAEADLAEIELRHSDLRGASLRSANLQNADLTQAYLSGADMSGADLSGARLSNTDLSRADLSEADLSGTDLSNSDMAEIDLRRANLSETKLFWADLSGRILARATCPGPICVGRT
jgi:hypothetical protein